MGDFYNTPNEIKSYTDFMVEEKSLKQKVVIKDIILLFLNQRLIGCLL